MASLVSSRNQSTHGRALLTELRDRRSARLDYIIDCLHKDPLSGRLKEEESGNNAYHLLLIGNYPVEFTENVLNKLLFICPEGAKAVNNHGSLPLHLALTSNRLNFAIVEKLLVVYPAGAAVADSQMLIPLFLCCMREDATIDICKALCKAFPNGPSTKNKTNSYPLHFAAKRTKPNLDILRVLIRRFPAAASAVNSFGLLPLHCVCALSADVQAVQLIHSAAPQAIEARDRQGRTCLHLAVLYMGREHSSAVQLEEEEARLQQQLEESDGGGGGGAAGYDSQSDDSDCEGRTAAGSKRSNEFRERDGTNRAVIRFLMHAYPQALCQESNFQATPADTVLEKLRPQRTKNKVVAVYGLYDDPLTARLLLLAQHHRSRATGLGRMPDSVILPNLRPRLLASLREFNWLARRDALGVALLGEPRYSCCSGSGAEEKKASGGAATFKLRLDTKFLCGTTDAATSAKKRSSSASVSSSAKGKGGVRKQAAASSGKATAGATSSAAALSELGASMTDMTISSREPQLSALTAAALKGNLLAQLRHRGVMDVVRTVFSFI